MLSSICELFEYINTLAMMRFTLGTMKARLGMPTAILNIYLTQAFIFHSIKGNLTRMFTLENDVCVESTAEYVYA